MNISDKAAFAILALILACAAIILHLYGQWPPPDQVGLVDPPPLSWACDVTLNCLECHPWAKGVPR